MKHVPGPRHLLAAALASAAALLGGSAGAALGSCGSFTDFTDPGFCPYVLEIFALGITTGTTPTTYDPASAVSRLQMAAFLSRTVDGVLKRGSRRAALNQFWARRTTTFFDLTTVGNSPAFPVSDGLDVWVPNQGDNTVSRVRAGDGRLLETWTGAPGATAALCALGSVFVTGFTAPGRLFRISPKQQPAGAVTTVASNLGNNSFHLAFDGGRIWTTNGASVSIVTPGNSIPWTVTTVATGFTALSGVLFDGANVWVADLTAGTLLRLDSSDAGSGAVLQTVTVGSNPYFPMFDGANIWVPNFVGNSVSVVRASSGVVLRTLTGNGLNFPQQAAFDGERVLITNVFGNSVSLWKAADLTAIGNSPTGEQVSGACSDGVNFWITMGPNHLARF